LSSWSTLHFHPVRRAANRRNPFGESLRVACDGLKAGANPLQHISSLYERHSLVQRRLLFGSLRVRVDWLFR
ncbi:hypothetical protein, partial [Bradyrhizobium japonicum]|uniref:hypothetical protein n=1 Tax=Bradyrhizobium japonicum TaxID=375 RepID=UPI001AEBF749